MKTIITVIIVAIITVKAIFAAVDNIAPQVQQAPAKTEQVIAQATE